MTLSRLSECCFATDMRLCSTSVSYRMSSCRHMFEMQTMSSTKDKEHSLQHSMASSFKTCGGHKKLLGVLCRSNSQKRPRLSNKGILKVSLISFGAALLLLYLLPGTLARYETSSFFPRLQYHKVNLRIHQLTFESTLNPFCHHLY